MFLFSYNFWVSVCLPSGGNASYNTIGNVIVVLNSIFVFAVISKMLWGH